jgi:hypothetical protein
MNRFTDTDINELNKLLENDTNKCLFLLTLLWESFTICVFIIYLDQTVLTLTWWCYDLWDYASNTE